MLGIAPKVGTHYRKKVNFSCMAALLSTALLAISTLPVNAAPAQQGIKLPPSADLSYSITAKQSGLTVKGDAVLHWSTSGKQYATSSEINAMMFGRLLETRSEGTIGTAGLIPVKYTEKRYRKREITAVFNHADNTVAFSETQQTYPLKGGEQDRASIIWQLVASARTAPSKFKPDTEWTFPVAGRRDVEPWTFKVIRSETIQTPLGNIQSLHLQKMASSKHRDQEIDIWLAPSLEWYPVQLRMSERDGSVIEQKLQKVTPGS